MQHSAASGAAAARGYPRPMKKTPRNLSLKQETVRLLCDALLARANGGVINGGRGRGTGPVDSCEPCDFTNGN